jgi:hypothetical protein
MSASSPGGVLDAWEQELARLHADGGGFVGPQPVIYLAGSLTEGFTAHGPYPTYAAAAAAHDGADGMLLTLNIPHGPDQDREPAPFDEPTA